MPKPIPQAVRDKLAKLIPMLSASVPGECAAAAAAIERILKANGLDWHDFTAHMTSGAINTTGPSYTSTGRGYSASGKPMWSNVEPTAKTEYQSAIIIQLIDAILHAERYYLINDKSRIFLSDLHRRAMRYDPLRMTDKQREWLVDIAERSGAGDLLGGL